MLVYFLNENLIEKKQSRKCNILMKRYTNIQVSQAKNKTLKIVMLHETFGFHRRDLYLMHDRGGWSQTTNEMFEFTPELRWKLFSHCDHKGTNVLLNEVKSHALDLIKYTQI